MVLTGTQIIAQSAVSTKSISFQSIENQLQKWQKSIEFLKRENKFYTGMLELSIQTAKGSQAVLLTDFQEKMLNFEQIDLANFSLQLQKLMTAIIIKSESNNLEELNKSQSHLMQQWEELEVVFKGLKLMAFEKIENGISVRIY